MAMKHASLAPCRSRKAFSCVAATALPKQVCLQHAIGVVRRLERPSWRRMALCGALETSRAVVALQLAQPL